MKQTRFIINATLWSELQSGVSRAVPVRAAIAYVGSGGAKLLALKRGDDLVVDMSLPTVRHGATDPKEIRKFMRRGVRVWTRAGLHAKFCVMGRSLIVGSANLSNNAHKRLDEAALLTSEPAAVRQALAAFSKMCTEPVRPKYLAKCIDEYRDPVFKPGERIGERSRKNDLRAKLWYMGSLVPINPSAANQRILDAADKRAKKRLEIADETELNWVQLRKRPKFWKAIQVGDWIIDKMTVKGFAPHVDAPQQVLGFDTYNTEEGTLYHRVLFESLESSEDMPWSRFQSRVADVEPNLCLKHPRRGPISDDAVADKILGFWTATGRLVRNKKRKR